MAAKTFTRDEVAKHNSEEDLWLIVDHKVYDLTDYVDGHPGGNVVLRQVAGTDATDTFFGLHRYEVLQKYQNLCIGTIEGEKPEVHERQAGQLDVTPFAEPLWLRPEFYSPYFNDSHRRLRLEMRKFVDLHVRPEAEQKEKDGTYISQELIDKMAQNGLLAMRLGPGKHLHGRELFGGAVDGKEFDYLHDMIISQELMLVMQRGFIDGNMAGMTISLSAVKEWLNDDKLREQIMEEVLSGKEKICLAITEAFAGSDVAGIRTTAELSEDGETYLINGCKKWITCGSWSSIFIVGCRSKKGLVVLLVRRGEGVTTQQMSTSYSKAAGTAYIQFDNVKVHRSCVLGKDGDGLKVILSNFNHERWMMACHTIRAMRVVTTEALKWSVQRKAFGKSLSDQPVIRAKLGKMIAACESCQAWLELLTAQMCVMTYAEQSRHLGGPIALLKAHATRTAHDIANEGINIFGGRGLTQGGMGRIVAGALIANKFDAILGGTEEILTDLGVKQALRSMPKAML